MSALREHMLGAEAVANLVDSRLPVADEFSQLYLTMSGVFIATGVAAADATAVWAEKAATSTSTPELIGAFVVAALPSGGAAFFWRRGWKSRGE